MMGCISIISEPALRLKTDSCIRQYSDGLYKEPPVTHYVKAVKAAALARLNELTTGVRAPT